MKTDRYRLDMDGCKQADDGFLPLARQSLNRFLLCTNIEHHRKDEQVLHKFDRVIKSQIFDAFKVIKIGYFDCIKDIKK